MVHGAFSWYRACCGCWSDAIDNGGRDSNGELLDVGGKLREFSVGGAKKVD